MTYFELIRLADHLLDNGSITIGDYEKMLEPLRREVQSVQSEQKMGHWYIDERPESDREVIYSNCEQSIFKYHKLDFDYRPNYCPNCGAKMEEVIK